LPGVRRRGRYAAVAVAVACAVTGTAQAASPGSTDELRLTTQKTGHSTGVVVSEVFNARYENGQLKPLRHSLVGFPKGTRFDALGAPATCAATDADFKSEGMSACPVGSRIGSGNATVMSTGTPTQIGPVEVDATVFGRKDGSLIVFSKNGGYLSSQLVRAKGRFQRTDPPPSCVVVTEEPPCEHGEFAPRSLALKIPARSRVVKGRRHNLITTPRRCTKSGRWWFFDKHTFEDGSVDLFVNRPRCKKG
jgi:hypothetical protein